MNERRDESRLGRVCRQIRRPLQLEVVCRREAGRSGPFNNLGNTATALIASGGGFAMKRMPDKVGGRIGLKSPCTSSNRLPWLWPYPGRRSATNLILCVAGPAKYWRPGVCFPSERSRLQSPLHREEFPRRARPAGRQSQWDLIPVRGGESATFPQFSEMDRAIAQRTGSPSD